MAGGGGTTNSTVTQSNLPAYARPFYESMMRRAEQESKTDYIPYQGDRIANMSSETQAGLNAATNYGNSGTGLLDNASSTVSNVANAAGNTNYTASNYNSGGFDANAAQQYMSPYMSAVTQKAQQDAIEKAAQAQATRNLQAAKAGSFGGSRAAVQNAIANNALQSNLTDIFVKGQQSAFENAQSQFNTDQARFLDQAKMNEQSRQFGADLGLRGLDLSRQAGMDMANLQQQTDDAALSRIKSLLGVGTTKEDYLQQELDQQYNDFVNQRDAERMNLQFLSSILQGVPISVNQDVTSSNQGNNLQGLLGSMGGLQSLMALGGSK